MGCGCDGNGGSTSALGALIDGFGDALGAVVGRRAGKVRTRQLGKALSGGRSGVNTAARVAGAFFRALRGIRLTSAAQRRAYDQRVIGLAKTLRSQLKRVSSPAARLQMTAQYVVRGLGGSAADGARAAAYVLGRANGSITASPRQYLRGQSSGSFTQQALRSVSVSTGGAEMSARPPGPFTMTGFRSTTRGGLPLVPAFPLRRFPAPASATPGGFNTGVVGQRVGSYAADDDDAAPGTPAIRPHRPLVSSLRPRVMIGGGSAAADADEGDEDEGLPGAAPGFSTPRAGMTKRVDMRQLFAARAAEAEADEGGVFQRGELPVSRELAIRSLPGAGALAQLRPGLRDADVIDAVAVEPDIDAVGDDVAGFGAVPRVWSRFRSESNMRNKIERLRAEIDQLEEARKIARTDKRRARIDYMIEYRRQRIDKFEAALREKSDRQADRKAWYVQQTARFSGIGYGAAFPIGASALDQIKPYLLPMSVVGLLGYLLVQSGLKPAASSRRPRRNSNRRGRGK
jgi:hypothetical protein